MPGMKVQKNPLPFAYSKSIDTKTMRFVYNRRISDKIPDAIMATGNVRRLEEFYEANKESLTLEDLRYLQARLDTAWKLERLEAEAKEAIKNGVLPPRPSISQSQGYTGLDLTLDESQSSNNGCWSCGMHMLFKSRGIDLSQEEIRAYRPDFKEGEEQQMSLGRRQMMDSDSTNIVYDQSDLVQKVLPNSCVTNVLLKPLPEFFVLDGGDYPKPEHPMNLEGFDKLPEKEQLKRVNEYNLKVAQFNNVIRNNYNLQARKQMADIVRKALTDDRSPVVLNLNGGHFVTITGINEEGTKLRVEDSLGSAGSHTNYISIDAIIRKYMGPGGKGMTLTWLKDLPTPEYVPANPDQPAGQADPQRQQQMDQNLRQAEADTGMKLSEEHKDAVTMEADGSLKVQDVPDTNIVGNPDPHPELGQLKGQSLNNSVKLDQTAMKDNLGGGTLKNDVVHLDKPEAELFLGDQQFYYPKKLLLKGDPALAKAPDYEATQEKREDMALDLEARIQKLSMEKMVPGKETFGSELLENRQQIYLESPDTVLYLARIYAIHKQMEFRRNVPEGQRPEQSLEPKDKDIMEVTTQKAIPVIRTLLEKSEGKIDLPKLACEKDTTAFADMVDNYVLDRELGANPNMVQRQEVITRAFVEMRDTGTGVNYFGFTRKENSPEYEDMLQGIIEYGRQLGPKARISGFDNHKLTQKCLNYVQDKMKVRSTSTGKVRFDATMRILGQVMPEKEFQALCNRINRVRGVEAKPNHKDFVSPETYQATRIPVQNAVKGQQPAGPAKGGTAPTQQTPAGTTPQPPQNAGPQTTI